MAEAVDVYCTGMEACQADRTTYGTGGIIAPRFATAEDFMNGTWLSSRREMPCLDQPTPRLRYWNKAAAVLDMHVMPLLA